MEIVIILNLIDLKQIYFLHKDNNLFHLHNGIFMEMIFVIQLLKINLNLQKK